MGLDSSKTLGGIGALLLVIGPLAGIFFPYAGILGLIGVILVMVALNGLAGYYNERGIFNNALYGFVTTIVGGIAFVGALVVSVLMALSGFFSDYALDLANPEEWVTTFTEGFSSLDLNFLFAFLGAIIAAFVVLFIVIVIAVIFYRKSLNLLASKSGVGMFGTAGMLLLIGAILTIIGIGLILIWVAFILLTIAFFSLKETATTQTQPASP